MTAKDAKHEAHRRLVHRLADQAADVERLTRDLDDEALARRVVEGKWSLKELAGHLWRVQQVFEGRLEAMLAGTTRSSPPGTPTTTRPSIGCWKRAPERSSMGSWAGGRLFSSVSPICSRRSGTGRRSTPTSRATTCTSWSSTWRTTKPTTSTRCTRGGRLSVASPIDGHRTVRHCREPLLPDPWRMIERLCLVTLLRS